MTLLHCIAVAGALSICFGQVRAQTLAETHVELKTTIEQWMDQMQQTQELEQRWANDKQVLQDSIVGLKGMIVQAESDIAEVQKRIDENDSETKDKLTERDHYNKAREAFRAMLPEVESEVAKLEPLFPKFYLDSEDGAPKLKGSLEDLAKHRKADPEEKEKLSLNGRLQPLLQILSDAERFHGKLWAVSHPLKVGEIEKQMKVLYFGLSRAYAVDEGGTVALQGWSDLEKGWQFEELQGEGMAAQVLALYQSADGTGESQIVNLPLALEEK